jgi:type II secretory pathway pseudopilin PulG
LIELLIVLGIVGILAGFVLVSVNPAVQFGKANDTERKAEISSIIKAIYQFSASPSSRGALPQCLVSGIPTPIPECDTDSSGVGVGNGGFEGAIQFGTAATNYDCYSVFVPNYLRDIPIDPSSLYSAAVTGYTVCKHSIGGVSRIYVISAGAEVFKTDGGCEVPGTLNPAMCISA